MNQAKSSAIVFIAGMHRSGTSALCAALAACGADFGDNLLAPMSGVNAEGFWEDAEIVAINEALLEALQSTWYAPPMGIGAETWEEPGLAALRSDAGSALRRLADRSDQPAAVKDPRFSLTLSFWLTEATNAGLRPHVITIGRSPLEVAGSLYQRDRFPLGYGLRLCIEYQRSLMRQLPEGAHNLNYENLLADPLGQLSPLVADLELSLNEEALRASVRQDLKHQADDGASGALASSVMSADNLDQCERELAQHYPIDSVLAEFAALLVARGQELSRIGEEHSVTLSTLDQRDADVVALTGEHREAIATIAQRDAEIVGLDSRLVKAGTHLSDALANLDERDDQVRLLDERLARLGAEHTETLSTLNLRDSEMATLAQEHAYALSVIQERDEKAQEFVARLEEAGEYIASLEAHLQNLDQKFEKIFKVPVFGPILRKLWKDADS